MYTCWSTLQKRLIHNNIVLNLLFKMYIRYLNYKCGATFNVFHNAIDVIDKLIKDKNVIPVFSEKLCDNNSGRYGNRKSVTYVFSIKCLNYDKKEKGSVELR